MARFIQQHVDSGTLAGFGLYGISAGVLLTLGLSLLHSLPESAAAGSAALLPDLARNLLASLRIGG